MLLPNRTCTGWPIVCQPCIEPGVNSDHCPIVQIAFACRAVQVQSAGLAGCAQDPPQPLLAAAEAACGALAALCCIAADAVTAGLIRALAAFVGGSAGNSSQRVAAEACLAQALQPEAASPCLAAW